jgi:hypothetical protein
MVWKFGPVENDLCRHQCRPNPVKRFLVAKKIVSVPRVVAMTS